MSRPDEYKILGARELNGALTLLGPKIEKKLAKGAIRAGASIIAKEAKQLAPVRTGTLKKSIQVVARSRRVGDAVVSVAVRKGKRYRSRGMDAWYAHLVEFGAKARGLRAQPFLRPALDAKKTEAFKAVGAYIARRISELASGKIGRR